MLKTAIISVKSCSISHCAINILVNFVPNKRFKLHQMGFLGRFVPRKRFRWNKVCTVWEKGGDCPKSS